MQTHISGPRLHDSENTCGDGTPVSLGPGVFRRQGRNKPGQCKTTGGQAGGLFVSAAESSPTWPLQRVKGQGPGAALVKLSVARDQTLVLFAVSNPLQTNPFENTIKISL